MSISCRYCDKQYAHFMIELSDHERVANNDKTMWIVHCN